LIHFLFNSVLLSYLLCGLLTSYDTRYSFFITIKATSPLIPYAILAFFLILFSILPHPILTSFVLLTSFIVLSGLSLYLSCPILGLLLLLVYFGALIIMFCYLLMYIPAFHSPRVGCPILLLTLSLVSMPFSQCRPSILPFLYSPSLILGLGALLLLALVQVVFLVELPRGGFTS